MIRELTCRYLRLCGSHRRTLASLVTAFLAWPVLIPLFLAFEWLIGGRYPVPAAILFAFLAAFFCGILTESPRFRRRAAAFRIAGHHPVLGAYVCNPFFDCWGLETGTASTPGSVQWGGRGFRPNETQVAQWANVHERLPDLVEAGITALLAAASEWDEGTMTRASLRLCGVTLGTDASVEIAYITTGVPDECSPLVKFSPEFQMSSCRWQLV